VINHEDRNIKQTSANKQNVHSQYSGDPYRNPQWEAADVNQIGDNPNSLIEQAINDFMQNEEYTPNGGRKSKPYNVTKSVTIGFETNGTQIVEDQATQDFFSNAAAILIKNPEAKVNVTGFASALNGPNQQLSEGRAAAVKNRLIQEIQNIAKSENTKIALGAIKDRITTQGAGERSSVSGDNNAQADRVAEVTIQ